MGEAGSEFIIAGPLQSQAMLQSAEMTWFPVILNSGVGILLASLEGKKNKK